MGELPIEKIVVYAGAVVALAVASPIIHRIKRTRGKNLFFQLIFLGGAITTILLVPDFIQDELFSPGGVLLVGTLFPVYESIVAVCTPGEQDDTAWLQFWISSATLSFATEFMDDIRSVLPSAGEHWFEFEFFFNLWLWFPLTDGSALIYDKLTKKYIAPVAKKVNKACEGYIGFVLTIVNTSYIWTLWFVFMTLPEEARRFFVVLLGTVYPIAASTVAITTEHTGMDDRYWLTYWCCFSLLFVAMDYLENFVGQIRGFYSLIAVATVYLFLPMFGGAEVVFRRFLVPLSGQYQNMLLHDAYLVKLGVMKDVPEKQRDETMEKAAILFMKKKVQ